MGEMWDNKLYIRKGWKKKFIKRCWTTAIVVGHVRAPMFGSFMAMIPATSHPVF